MGIKYTDGGGRLTCFGVGGTAVWIEPGKHPPPTGGTGPEGAPGVRKSLSPELLPKNKRLN